MTDFNFWIIIVFLILLIVVVSIVRKENKEDIKPIKEFNSADFDIKLPSFSYVDFAPAIEKLSASQLREIVRQIYKSFRCFDYQKMSLDNLEQKEWHSWQVSMLLFCFKKDVEFEIYNPDEIFPDFLLKADNNSLKSLLKTLLQKYENYVAILDGKDKLSKDYIWSNRDISIIFYILSKYKKFN